jgi:hypothetical protein
MNKKKKKFEPVKSRSWDYIKDTESTTKETIGKQSVNDKETIGKQSVNDKETIGKQSVNDKETIGKQSVNDKETTGKQSVNDKETIGKQSVNDKETTGKQSVNDKSENNLTLSEAKKSIFNLTGLQKSIFEYVMNNLNSNLETELITTDELLNIVSCSAHTLKVLIARLYKKKLLINLHSKTGKGGFRKFMVTKITHKAFCECVAESRAIGKQEQSLMSSIYNSNTTNTIKNKVREIDTTKNHSIEQKDQLITEMQKQIAELQKRHHQDDSTSSAIEKTEVDNDDLYEIDISPLEPFGFTQKHLKQVIAFNSKLDDRSKINADDLEESIQHYAWALENRFEEMTEKYGKSFANNKLKILMGVLKKGQSWTEPQFRSAEEIALEEQVKANKEKLKKLQALQEEAFNSAYELWKLELTKEQYTKIKDSLPSSYANLSDGSKMLVTALKNHFRENVYKG